MESQTYTTLQPVPLNLCDTINSSSCDIDPSQALCNYFLGPELQPPPLPPNVCNNVSGIFKSLDELLSQPKDTFVSKVLEATNENTDMLEILRIELFKAAKLVDGFPYERSNLKRRLERRTKDGDSLTTKLARDCYVLKMACTGSFTNDLNDVLTVKSAKSTSSSENTNANDHSVANLNINENISRIDRDSITLRGEYIQDSEYLNRSVGTLSENQEKLNDTSSKHTSRLQNLQNQIKIIRDGKILKNCASLEERLSAIEELFVQKSHVFDEVSRLSKTFSDLSKSMDELKQCQEKHKSDITILKTSVKELHNGLRNESLLINNISDQRASGVSSLKAKVDLLSDKVKDGNNLYDHLEHLVSSCGKSVSDLRKKINSVEKTIKTRDERTFAEATKASPEISIQTENSGQYAEKHSSEKQHDSFPGHQIALSLMNDRSPVVQDNKNDSQQSPGQNRLPNGINVPISGVITAPRGAKQSADDERQMKSDVAADLHPRNIPVYLSNDANMVSRREKFDFHGNNRKRWTDTLLVALVKTLLKME